MTTNPDVFRAFAEALAIGMLVGIERYRDRGTDERRSAGVRTFTITALIGAVCGLLQTPGITMVTFAALAAMFSIGYWHNSQTKMGLTTEFAAVLVFWLGYLMHQYELPAISAGIVLTIVLALKRELHRFVLESISEREFYDTLKFLVVVIVVYPVLPDRAMGPWGFFNPTKIWALVMLVSVLSYCGYLAMRLLGPDRGLKWGAVVGGLVSTTAVTMALAQRAKASPPHSRVCGIMAVMANAVQFPRLLVLAWALDAGLAIKLAPALLAMGATGLVGALILDRLSKHDEPAMELGLVNPFSLKPALEFGFFFVLIYLFVSAGEAWLGSRGVYVASLLAGIGDASAITLSMATKVSAGTLAPVVAALAVFLAVTVNAITKWVLAWTSGTREMALYLGGGLLAMLATGYLVLYLSSGLQA